MNVFVNIKFEKTYLAELDAVGDSHILDMTPPISGLVSILKVYLLTFDRKNPAISGVVSTHCRGLCLSCVTHGLTHVEHSVLVGSIGCFTATDTFSPLLVAVRLGLTFLASCPTFRN